MMRNHIWIILLVIALFSSQAALAVERCTEKAPMPDLKSLEDFSKKNLKIAKKADTKAKFKTECDGYSPAGYSCVYNPNLKKVECNGYSPAGYSCAYNPNKKEVECDGYSPAGFSCVSVPL